MLWNADREKESVELADLSGQTLKKINEVKAETQTATTKEEMEKLNHYTNFQPLDSRINRFQKKHKIEYQPVPPPPFPTK